MKWDPEVRAAIAAVNPSIDPKLVHAIIQKESSHGAKLVTHEPNDPKTGLPRYSYGPMMVLDTTARGVYGISDPSTLASNPALGILVGVKYLNSKLRAYPGDVRSAIAAYNAGSARRTKKGGTFVNQEYVDIVLGFWKQYGGAVAAGGGVLVLLVIGLLLLRSRRLRAA